MAAFVQCVSRIDSPYPHERILAIGGVTSAGRWRRSAVDAIRDIQANPRSYFVLDRRTSRPEWIVLAVSDTQQLYLTTDQDSETQRTLLQLFDCSYQPRIKRVETDDVNPASSDAPVSVLRGAGRRRS